MTHDIDKLVAQARKLPDADRIQLVEQILATMDGGPSGELAEAWIDEIERRSGEIDRGDVQGVPWSEVKDRVRRRMRDIT